MLELIDQITAAFLGAMQSGQKVLAGFTLPILIACFAISYRREYAATVMSSGAGLGDALAHMITLGFAAGCYLFLMTYLFDIANAALDTMFAWGLQASGSGVSSAQLRTPSFIMEAGLKAAQPIANFDTWFSTVKSWVKLANHPGDLVSYWGIVLAFIGITLHHMMMLIEFYLALMLAPVLFPWGLWRITSGIAEFSFGWLTGGLIRALVSTAMIGIATPLFPMLAQPLPETGFFTLPQTFVLLGCSLIFLVLCWVIPARATQLAGHASLGLTGSTLVHAAMSTARFGLMASGLGSTVTRVISPMLRRP